MHQRMEYNLLFDWIVKTIPDIFEGINTPLIKNKLHKIRNVPKIYEWLSFYKRSKLIGYSIFEIFYKSHPDCECFFELFSFYFLISEERRKKILQEELKYFYSLTISEKKIYLSNVRMFHKKLQAESEKIINDNYDYISSSEALSIISKPELLFFIRVIFPCLILHGELPSSLLRKSRNGDEESLIKIVRIDKSVIFDKIISQNLHLLSFNNPHRFEILNASLAKKPPSVSKSKLKSNFVGLLSKIGHLYEDTLGVRPLTSTQIRLRFDQEAQRQGQGLIDIDLPISDEAFYMWMYRKEDFWKILSNSYKK